MMLRRLLLGTTALIAVSATTPAFAGDDPLTAQGSGLAGALRHGAARPRAGFSCALAWPILVV